MYCGSHLISAYQKHVSVESHISNSRRSTSGGKDDTRPVHANEKFQKKDHPDYVHKNSTKLGHDLNSYEENWKTNAENVVVEQDKEHDIYITNTGSPSDASKDVLAVKETSKPYKLITLEDNSLFPAWAIALVVLCVVIIVMLIVLILY